ncbi:PH domain-containing protein [Mollicutes bacterium LVI A0039]|nr:PH domain-containing protein [Mollicutes bacterium LVI A0039]
MENILNWTFINEVTSPLPIEATIIFEGEQVLARFQTIRDTALITDKRFIVVDSQGITGKKKEIYVVPFKSINMFSTENSGKFDLNSEIELWTKSGRIKINLKRGIDVQKFNKIIARHIC